MATLDDIPTLPAAGTGLTVDDLVGVINKNDLRSPKKVSLTELLSLFGLAVTVNDGTPNDVSLLGSNVSMPSLRYFDDTAAAVAGGLVAGDLFYTVNGVVKVVYGD